MYYTFTETLTHYRWISDIHLDHNSDFELLKTPFDETTMLMVAGDLSNKDKRKIALDWLNQQSQRFALVVVVLGNHDYWNASIEREVPHWRSSLPKNVFVLNRDSLYLSSVNVYVHGCTLWTDAKKGDPSLRFDLHQKNGFQQPMYPDVKFIRAQKYMKTLGYDGIINQHRVDRQWILDTFESAQEDSKHILLVHYSPWISPQLPARFKLYHDAFWWNCSDMEVLFDCKVKPFLLVHGHTHSKMDYMANTIRTVCNPRGYYDGDVMQFDNMLLEKF